MAEEQAIVPDGEKCLVPGRPLSPPLPRAGPSQSYRFHHPTVSTCPNFLALEYPIHEHVSPRMINCWRLFGQHCRFVWILRYISHLVVHSYDSMRTESIHIQPTPGHALGSTRGVNGPFLFISANGPSRISPDKSSHTCNTRSPFGVSDSCLCLRVLQTKAALPRVLACSANSLLGSPVVSLMISAISDGSSSVEKMPLP